jgi:hypothetical protein
MGIFVSSISGRKSIPFATTINKKQSATPMGDYVYMIFAFHVSFQ